MTVTTDLNQQPESVMDDEEMRSCCLGNLVVIINTRGAIPTAKGTYPARFGIYGEIRSREFAFHFNPTGEIRYMRGLTRAWPHPWEWLKRSWGNDWVYYSVGLDRGQGRVKDWVGEDYLPCLSYESNAIREVTPYTEPGIARAFSAWSQVYGTLCTTSLEVLAPEMRAFVEQVIKANDDSALIRRAEDLHRIIGGRVSVLPPDTRHVDYEVIPLNIADGCLYKCRFCSVKSRAPFASRSDEEIAAQIEALKGYYGSSLQNFNALFLGDHDALAAGGERVAHAAQTACEAFGFGASKGAPPSVFLFGSCASFSKAGDETFKALEALPCTVYINLGLESADNDTLKMLGKPITAAMVTEALHKMVSVNARYPSVNVTANFLLGTTFSKAHHASIMALLGSVSREEGAKGCVYLSPLVETQRREEVLPMFHEIKEASGLPAYVYLIQRL
ncbi:radical SAM protein [Desulfoluna butyratoxydans]|uniref:Radical sam n=1 Tax=Desulfoluna butyratoxydans TaxID=231438 RepID=A0A4U8YKQ6_9BACT|nr:radical SAM protein [Desulfoluna butyratoxydans]VFQ44140.1 radical sam [Desulfoluna butyratoxydans]